MFWSHALAGLSEIWSWTESKQQQQKDNLRAYFGSCASSFNDCLSRWLCITSLLEVVGAATEVVSSYIRNALRVSQSFLLAACRTGCGDFIGMASNCWFSVLAWRQKQTLPQLWNAWHHTHLQQPRVVFRFTLDDQHLTFDPSQVIVKWVLSWRAVVAYRLPTNFI